MSHLHEYANATSFFIFYSGDNGIGRIDIVENRFIGMKSRGMYVMRKTDILSVLQIVFIFISISKSLFYAISSTKCGAVLLNLV